ncbi:MAG: flavodoxin family protein [Pseudomonadales bacterium]|jgi:multimeric flavodoxin WrbA|nr:flavodoxin family protein [Pseudomonadales bacterium]MDP7357425.1 flavodoxin family protein [Pseudomonadales bacterium]MDP7595503.1 flavodoxin family protein [Pseudomonadales bacterium]HJN52455.1 flavodoxin family protein [Pseudomonadales bacterium]|tara:strand:+ start:156 stop:827 length:672 start_codon:yes stop_codon:yes gene_type:complete
MNVRDQEEAMHILAINGSPRRTGNTSRIIRAILKGAESDGAETTHVNLHAINMKGCQGCLSCRKKPGICAQKDDLSPHLEAMKTCDALILGSPIYMYRITGQMKLWLDRCYSLYTPREQGDVGEGYGSAVTSGKPFAMVVSQGAEEDEQYRRSIRYLAGMGATGLGFVEAGRIVHSSSAAKPAKKDEHLLDEARALGQRLVAESKNNQAHREALTSPGNLIAS